MPDDYVYMITDPWVELDIERERHAVTLGLIKLIWLNAHVLDGGSKVSTKICKLCEEIPTGKNLSWRAICPLHNRIEYTEKELGRLSSPYRRQIPKAKQHAAQDATTPDSGQP